MKRILVIEDTKSLRDAVLEILSANGYEVKVASNGRYGLFIAREFMPDLIICDIVMPDVNGYEVLRELRSSRETSLIPFIFITVKSDRKAHRMAMSGGADDYIVKPFSEEELMGAVNSQFERQKNIKYRLESVTKERLTYLLSTSPSVIFSLEGNESGNFTYMSDNVFSLLGYEPDKFLKEPSFWLSLIHPDDLRYVKLKVLSVLREKNIIYKYRILHKNGEYRWIYDERKFIGDGKEIIGSWLDISALQEAEELLEYRLELEGLVSDVSASFINSPASMLDSQINRSLALTGKVFKADRCSIVLFSEDMKRIETVYKWHSDKVKIKVDGFKEEALKGFLWAKEQFNNSDYIQVSDLSLLPPEGSNVKEVCSSLGVKSFLVVSIKSGRNCPGFFGISTDRKETLWKEEDIVIIRLLAEIFINVIDKKIAEESLQYSSQMEALITNIATRFIKFKDHSEGDNIKQTLKVLKEFVEADRAFLYTFSWKKKKIIDSYNVYKSDIKERKTFTSSDFLNIWKHFDISDILNIKSVVKSFLDLEEEKKYWKSLSIEAILAVPLYLNNSSTAFLGFIKEEKEYNWREVDLKLLKHSCEIFTEVLSREIEKEGSSKERNIRNRKRFHNIIGKSNPMQEVYDLIEDLADVKSTVLITGDSGTGKELVAEAIHYRGFLRNKPLVKVNCSSLSESLQESELFGHIKGAFTGAIRNQAGRFEKAEGGTIFLDEIGDISLGMQRKLLRVLQEKEFERVGEGTPIKADVRVISATNKDLYKMVREGTFREDLYYRLKVVEIKVPPLKERKEDIPLLIDHFMKKFNLEFRKKVVAISDTVRDIFVNYSWPGNVRELEHAIEHAFIVCRNELITPAYLPKELGREVYRPVPKKEEVVNYEEKAIREVLEEVKGNKAKAAQLLNMSRPTLYRKIKKYGINLESSVFCT